MQLDPDDLEVAIYNAVTGGNERLSGHAAFGAKAVPGLRAARNLKARLKSLLEQMPQEFTVFEILEAMNKHKEE